jgi:hypothetical protein
MLGTIGDEPGVLIRLSELRNLRTMASRVVEMQGQCTKRQEQMVAAQAEAKLRAESETHARREAAEVRAELDGARHIADTMRRQLAERDEAEREAVERLPEAVRAFLAAKIGTDKRARAGMAVLDALDAAPVIASAVLVPRDAGDAEVLREWLGRVASTRSSASTEAAEWSALARATILDAVPAEDLSWLIELYDNTHLNARYQHEQEEAIRAVAAAVRAAERRRAAEEVETLRGELERARNAYEDEHAQHMRAVERVGVLDRDVERLTRERSKLDRQFSDLTRNAVPLAHAVTDLAALLGHPNERDPARVVAIAEERLAKPAPTGPLVERVRVCLRENAEEYDVMFGMAIVDISGQKGDVSPKIAALIDGAMPTVEEVAGAICTGDGHEWPSVTGRFRAIYHDEAASSLRLVRERLGLAEGES